MAKITSNSTNLISTLDDLKTGVQYYIVYPASHSFTIEGETESPA